VAKKLISEEVSQVTSQEAAQIIEREKAERLQAFVQDIQAAMDKHKCSLLSKMTIEGTQVRSEIVPVHQ
jgi:ATP-dependent Zn protease